MQDTTHRRLVLAARPEGMPRDSDFRLETGAVPQPGPGEVLVRAVYLSIDPYMRGRISAARSYAAPVAIGDTMVGGVVGEVLVSRHPSLAPGDIVEGMLGWQTHAVAPAAALRRIDPSLAPISTALGVLGMPGLSAYFALLEVGRPQPGDTVLVSAASGAVGAVVGQIARIAGCRVVGVAGSDAKVDYVVGELGFDAGINYRSVGDLTAAVGEACPGGVDVFFDNVGGTVHDAAMLNLALRARVVICGNISLYNRLDRQDTGLRHLRPLLVNRARMEGFLVMDHQPRYPEALARLGAWVREGRIRYRESIAQGLESAPRALAGLLEGRNFGKQLVQVGPPPA